MTCQNRKGPKQEGLGVGELEIAGTEQAPTERCGVSLLRL